MGRYQRDYFDHECFYHIYNKVVTGKTLFKEDGDYQSFLKKYTKYLSPYFDTYAYCLIPNHFHFLVKVKEAELIDVTKEDTNAARKYLIGEEDINYFLEGQLRRMFSSIALKARKTKKGEGALFKTGTKRVELKTESRFIYQLCYIHHNPIHHGLRRDFNEWKYSSYHAYLSDEKSQIDRAFVWDLLGGKDEFLELHKDFKLNQKEDLFGEF